MDGDQAREEASRILGLFSVLPRLVVFDLDYTLWPFYCCNLTLDDAPYLYPYAKGILYALKDHGIDIAIASRSTTPDLANTFLERLGIDSMFVTKEIYPSFTHKTGHLQAIQETTGASYDSMLFFDDEDRNVQGVSQMGVSSLLVRDGVDLEAFKLGLTNFGSSAAVANGYEK